MNAGLVCVGLLLGACGGSSSRSRTAPKPAAAAAWAASTQQLCREKQAAIASLGGIHITYGGIARAGLPAVKRSLDGYLSRLLAVLRDFSQRQRALATPPAFVPAMKAASQLDAESQATTRRLQTAVARVTSVQELTAAFRTWTTTLGALSAQGNAVAVRLNLPGCRA